MSGDFRYRTITVQAEAEVSVEDALRGASAADLIGYLRERFEEDPGERMGAFGADLVLEWAARLRDAAGAAEVAEIAAEMRRIALANRGRPDKPVPVEAGTCPPWWRFDRAPSWLPDWSPR